jgi:hypothetical protein
VVDLKIEKQSVLSGQMLDQSGGAARGGQASQELDTAEQARGDGAAGSWKEEAQGLRACNGTKFQDLRVLIAGCPKFHSFRP